MTAEQTNDQRKRAGQALRTNLRRSDQGSWAPRPDRPDPVDLLEENNRPRLPDLVPVRYGRMLALPFAFLRGSAVIMADDLAGTPATGVRVQACGDAHLGNFGVFGTPERNLVFDVNDFDETLARAHARSGDAATIAGYLGTGTAFDQAIARFA
ncbi:MAG TPA: DUF2252 family protein, partial [Streptosporangiaceae bacterium]|nr:DUF2252 family protein [Streptosporangiaceae bacterium]